MTGEPLPLPPGLPPGPLLIGATGGSGTRAVAQLVHRAGVWIGSELNDSWDALPLGLYSNRWIDRFWSATAGWRHPLPAELRGAMAEDLAQVLRGHLKPLLEGPERGRWTAWGWKEPRCMYLLPFWCSLFPGLRFLHLLRDGRDMAFSGNQNQLAKHGATVLGPAWAERSQPERSIALWARVNSRVAAYGEKTLKERYLAVRFEALCASPAEAGGRVLAFFGLSPELAERAVEVVSPPATVGRFLGHDPKVVAHLEAIAAPALARFGYPVPWRSRLRGLLASLLR